MKKRINLRGWIGAVLPMLLATGCTSAFYAASSNASDDLYVVHNRTEIARRQQAEAEARKAEAEARRAEMEAMLAEAEAASTEHTYYNRNTEDSYASVLADDYQSAYARRLRGFSSPSYRCLLYTSDAADDR